MILELLFVQFNFCTFSARNGFEAYEIVQDTIAKNETPFDLVVLDLQMPISDGYDACKNILGLFNERKLFKIKTNQSSFSETVREYKIKPIMVAASSFVNDEVMVNTNAAGFDRTLTVPLRVPTLNDTIIPLLE